MDQKRIDFRRIGIFLGFAYGIAWSCALVIYLTGGLVNSPQLGGTGISLALVLLATVYMGAPAMAHILTRLVTGEGWKNLNLQPKFRKGWGYWLAAYFGPGILTIIGGLFFFLVFPQYYDPALGKIQELFSTTAARTGQPIPAINPWIIVAAQTAQAMLIAPVINSLFTFGEEFGWRAYLQPKLMPLGGRKAMMIMGLIWGVWHWPVIAMGHNYGLDYIGFPWLGMLAMVWFTILLGTCLGWVTLRAGSVWPAVIGHAAINGIAGIAILFVKGQPNPLQGPMPVGIVGSMGFTLVVLALFLKPGALNQQDEKTEVLREIEKVVELK